MHNNHHNTMAIIYIISYSSNLLRVVEAAIGPIRLIFPYFYKSLEMQMEKRHLNKD